MGLFPLTLRPARGDESAQLVDIACAAFATSIGQTAEFKGQSDTVRKALVQAMPHILASTTVAEIHAASVGFAALKGMTGQIGDVWVHPDHQDQGVGAMLLAASEARVKAQGLGCAWLKTHAENTRALDFYRTHGYALLSVELAPWGAKPEIIYPKATLGKQLSRPNAKAATSMADVRVGIDTLDPMLVSLIAERFAFIDRAADLKPAIAMPARVNTRVEEVVTNARKAAQAIGFDADLTENLWRTMIDLAIAHEETKMGPDSEKTPDESAA